MGTWLCFYLDRRVDYVTRRDSTENVFSTMCDAQVYGQQGGNDANCSVRNVGIIAICCNACVSVRVCV